MSTQFILLVTQGAVDLTNTHPFDDNRYHDFDFTVRSTSTLADINSTSSINLNKVFRKAII